MRVKSSVRAIPVLIINSREVHSYDDLVVNMVISINLVDKGVILGCDQGKVIDNRQIGDRLLWRQRLAVIMYEVPVEVRIVVRRNRVEHG